MTKDSGHPAAKLTEAAQDTARGKLEALLNELSRIRDGSGSMARALEWDNDAAQFLHEHGRSLLAESVPAGWKLVPVDPTQEMRRAGRAALDPSVVSPSHVWRMMLLAAPGHSQEEER